ncbi:acyl-homoserine-lactone synthase [Aliivibrio sp. EL58]|uniref:acyl-homoserine-lactone synthase n=1 Tax=Aliivibrio sp. EL58 TaxID=2107582 RepID=UPI000EFC4413|nr:acyl-homoserine-lactone synthase [Aliivibrio sp. EL58]
MAIMIKNAEFTTISKGEYLGILSLRYQVFKKRLQWDLASENDLESDQYDNDSAEYIYACDDSRNVNGCWRLLPTTGDYMLKSIFSELLGHHKAPSDPQVVELSRFAVGKRTSKMNESVSEITMKLFEAIYFHAIKNDIKEYVTVTSIAIERLLKRMNIPCERIGDQKVHLLGETKSIVLSMPINNMFKEAIAS